MKSLEEWLDEYAESHQNPQNKMIHYLCIPPITWSTLGIAFILSPTLLAIILIGAFYFYYKLAPRLAWGMAVFLLLTLPLLLTHPHILTISLATFIIAWVAQIWGHQIEGKKPSFVTDLQFLLIGPLWILNKVYEELGLVATERDLSSP